MSDPRGVYVVSSNSGMDRSRRKPMGNTVDGTRNWSTVPCACCADCSSCCRGCCCIPCMLCDIAERLGEWMCFPFCVPCGGNVLRTRLRTLGGIRGTACDDCMTMCCCCACAVWQMDKELDEMGIP
ncbi:placenta-specific gene 8 protein-like [Crassostrea angulata]|uniref:Uncharacterized protein n=2 Tax=Magallana gigas TaxID=29159 RepID=A0A8W8JHR0_MAGGI|nr:placenta-specific gene 8 protein [Crassostrea gigas]XP_034335610.1 placenta-specific gene 8 protein-like [Crassostrea gigas]XP_052708269.1 placenta-specific gene 8 protein-like [Crassostrea angulata]|eukprot:XP_011434670.1 PREDICTED: placenta-specific gene 8 protein [Crassostrea gigas]